MRGRGQWMTRIRLEAVYCTGLCSGWLPLMVFEGLDTRASVSHRSTVACTRGSVSRKKHHGDAIRTAIVPGKRALAITAREDAHLVGGEGPEDPTRARYHSRRPMAASTEQDREGREMPVQVATLPTQPVYRKARVSSEKCEYASVTY